MSSFLEIVFEMAINVQLKQQACSFGVLLYSSNNMLVLLVFCGTAK
jgi:hypothetical protein